MKTIFISAGEASGDMHAAALLTALQARNSGLRCFGLGGGLMRERQVELLYDLRDLAVAGFWEVAKKIFHFRRIYHATLAEIDRRKPDLAIFVDYPGMNLRMAAECHRRGIKTVYYIVPQVWAWKKGRIAQIERDVDLLVSILPFEKTLFDPKKLRCEFVGSPLLDHIDEIAAAGDFRADHGVGPEEKIIALLPGSRSVEVNKHYEIMLQAIKQLREAGEPVRAFTAIRDELSQSLYSECEARVGIEPTHISAGRYDLLRNCSVAFVASGTATLEAALCGRPFCVVYRTGWITYQIARRVIKLDSVGLVNIVAGKKIVPEFLQNEMTPDNLAKFCTEVLSDPVRETEIVMALSEVRHRLGDKGASERAAELIDEGFLQ